MKRVILVPRRPDKGQRDRLWAFTRPYWECLGYEIVEGDHLTGPFSRSAALNTAARQAGDWDTAILLDSDVLVDLKTVEQGVELSEHTGKVVHPFRIWKGLNPGMTDEVMKGYSGNWDRGIKETYNDNISACVIVPRRVWECTGGFDERFQGWGWEDSAWMWAVRSLTDTNLRLKGDLWHLFHHPSPERNSASRLWKANRDLALRYHSVMYSPSAMLDLLTEEGGPLP